MAEKHTKKEDDETIDFSKIKSWFSGKGKKHHAAEHAHKEEKSEEIKFDYNSAAKFFIKNATIFLILIPIILTIYLRVQPMYLPATDDWAQNAVYNYYQSQISSQISQQYPNLPDTNKQALIASEFQKFLEQNSDTVQQQIDGTSQQFKDKLMYESGNSKYVYLGDIDSYYWLRDARKFLQNGTMCDEVDYEKQLCYADVYTSAPIKSASPMTDYGIGKNGKLYAYTIAYTYKIMKFFSPDVTIMQASFYVPLIFGIISAILAFLIGKVISGNVGGLVTSIFISSSPIYLSRTLGSDNDPLSMFFPLLIVWAFIYTFEAKDLKKRILFGALTGLSMSLYAAAWQGWWSMFYFIFATLIIYAGFYVTRQVIRKKKIVAIIKSKETKGIALDIALVLFSTAAFITIISGFRRFTEVVTSPFWFMQTKVAALENFWPNVLVTVAEFNPGSIPTIISQMGGKLLFFLGMMGVVFVMLPKEDKIPKEQKYVLGFGALIYLLLVSSYGTSLNPKIYMALIALPVILGMLMLLKSDKEVDVKLAILLVIWFIATSYAALKGVRFTLLMVSAFGVAFGITISSIYARLSRWISTELKINEAITKVVVLVLLLLLLVSPLKAGYAVAANYIPSVNDAWYDSLIKIKDNSQQDAIINSWWDFGHWFKYLADRRVTLDGSSQSGPPLHWLGKLMVTHDEKQSVGILKMLDCGSNSAFEELNKILDDTSRSIDILDKIVTLEKEDARDILAENGLTNKQQDTILQYTHCNPPENFFITSEDMVGKAGVWAHFGSWDFKRAEMYSSVKGKTIDEARKILTDKEYNLTPEQADQYYYEIQTQEDNQWISPWPSYMSGVQPCDKPNNEGVMLCRMQASNGQLIPLNVDLKSMDVKISATEEYSPVSLVYVTPNGTEEKKFGGNTLQFSVVLIPKGEEGYSVLITHPDLADSMFTRLFYLGGHGLRYFDKFDDQTGITGGRIIVWKVDWEGKDANLPYKPIEKQAADEEPAVTEAVNASVTKNKTKE